jgi:hypothetical protein
VANDTCRELAIREVWKHVVECFNVEDMDRAQRFERLLSTLELMGDIEFDSIVALEDELTTARTI